MKLKRIFAAVIFAAALAGLSGCGSSDMTEESLPEDTVEKLETAINNRDKEAMLECSVQYIRDTFDMYLNDAEETFDGDELEAHFNKLITECPPFSAFLQGYGEWDEIPPIDFKVTETYIKGDKAAVYFKRNDDEKIISWVMAKEDGEWRLSLDPEDINADNADKVIINEETE